MVRRGYSRDHRPDCEQLVIALIVNHEGFPFSFGGTLGSFLACGVRPLWCRIGPNATMVVHIDGDRLRENLFDSGIRLGRE